METCTERKGGERPILMFEAVKVEYGQDTALKTPVATLEQILNKVWLPGYDNYLSFRAMHNGASTL